MSDNDSTHTAPHEAYHEELLQLARETLAHYLATGEVMAYESTNEWFQTPAAVFVTLRVREGREEVGPNGETWLAGDLRGCIGQIDAERPLYSAVQDAAIKAATTDPRFYPVTAGELENLTIEVSVLSPLRLVESLNEIEVGEDGLFIVGYRRRGLLLPEVPLTYGWGKREFLRALYHKAGLPEDAWPDAATLFAFTTESFEER